MRSIIHTSPIPPQLVQLVGLISTFPQTRSTHDPLILPFATDACSLVYLADRPNIPQHICTPIFNNMHRFPLLVRTIHRGCNPLRHVSTSAATSATSPLVLQIWGANTGVGKTVFSAALLRTAEKPSLYLKPVQSGFPDDDDAKIVTKHASNARAAILHALAAPVSPDLAATLSGTPPILDQRVLEHTASGLSDFLSMTPTPYSSARVLALVETAGGVLSPSPQGSVQADVYRPLRLPAVLLGDATLGGVSTTLAAYEALRLRGYDVSAVVFFEGDGELENEVSVERHVRKDGTGVFQAPPLPPKHVALEEYFKQPEVDGFFLNLYGHLRAVDDERFTKMKRMCDESKDIFWYPFTQHAHLKEITCIDSGKGDLFTCYHPQRGLYQMVDGIGSWWTNGAGHGNAEISKAVGRASGRYGHVMFPEATYEPAFDLAKRLLEGPGKSWATRVFYSDDGSTAVEVALKMAFRKRAVDFPERVGLPVRVVGLNGCYHGDTLGVMDCAPCSDFNMSQTPWYEPRGLFFEPPTAAVENGVWRLFMPEWTGLNCDITLSGVGELFDTNRIISEYGPAIAKRLDTALENNVELGACLLEPVLLGAGGMQLVDPAFQRALVQECRMRRIPVVFDEVFTGLWRLGKESGAELIGEFPDIATYGKLLTGGVVPIAATVTTEEVFRAFHGDSKVNALLHGHSYSGHAIGCAAGVEALRQYECLKDGRKYWDEGVVGEISCMAEIDHAMALGTVFAFRLKGDGGYASTAARELVESLKAEDVFVRPLGNVIYLMCAPVSEKGTCDLVIRKVHSVLGKVAQKIDYARRYNEGEGISSD